MKTLRIIKPVTPYNVGEIAGFDDERAAYLTKHGFAEVAGKQPAPFAESGHQSPDSGPEKPSSAPPPARHSQRGRPRKSGAKRG